jgi:hypothetical protein
MGWDCVVLIVALQNEMEKLSEMSLGAAGTNLCLSPTAAQHISTFQVRLRPKKKPL